MTKARRLLKIIDDPSDYDVMVPNMETVNEAREYIKEFLKEKVLIYRKFAVGFSGGKDSCVLLQLVMEACEELGGDFKDRLIVQICHTRYELNFQWEHVKRQADRIKAAGYHVNIGQTILEESYGLVCLGVGIISQIKKFRICNKMKETVMSKFKKEVNVSFSGIRSEESPYREKQERVSVYGGKITSCSAIKDFKLEDVWGYLHHVGTTKWGTTYEEIRDYYLGAKSNRDGCWVCCYHKGTDNYSPAQKVVIQKLDAIRNTGVDTKKLLPGQIWTGLDYPGRTVDWPTIQAIPVCEWIFSHRGQAGLVRPVNVCRQAYKIVCDIEKEYNEVDKIIFPDEKRVIPDLQTMRERYHIVSLRRWMLNPLTWGGRRLLDLDPLTEETYKKYFPPTLIARRLKQGDWFGRWAREYQRRHLFEKELVKRGIEDLNTYWPSWETARQVKRDVIASPYCLDEKCEPWEGFYSEGDPADMPQEELELEKIAANWYK